MSWFFTTSCWILRTCRPCGPKMRPTTAASVGNVHSVAEAALRGSRKTTSPMGAAGASTTAIRALSFAVGRLTGWYCSFWPARSTLSRRTGRGCPPPAGATVSRNVPTGRLPKHPRGAAASGAATRDINSNRGLTNLGRASGAKRRTSAGLHYPDMDRRTFHATALGGAAALAAPARKLQPLAPGMKISLQVPTEPSAEDLQFARQLGVHWVNIPTGGERATAENFVRLKQKAEAAGLMVWNIGNSNVHNMPEVTLNLPGRDAKIAEYKQYLRNLAQAGIQYTTYAHMGNGIWSSERESTRGGASARAFDAEKNPKGYWAGKVFEAPLSHGRKYSKEEIWENYTYFIRQAAPVAEELGIRIGIHPDDPPVPELAGVPRCIFGNFDGLGGGEQGAVIVLVHLLGADRLFGAGPHDLREEPARVPIERFAVADDFGQQFDRHLHRLLGQLEVHGMGQAGVVQRPVRIRNQDAKDLPERPKVVTAGGWHEHGRQFVGVDGLSQPENPLFLQKRSE